METKFKSLLIINECSLLDYIKGTSRMSEKNAKETTTYEQIREAIINYANNESSYFDFINYGFQIECLKDSDRVHCFVYKAEFRSELIVSYMGTLK